MGSRGPQEVDLFVMLGIIFAGAGVALSVTLGPFMAGMVLVGLVLLAKGLLNERNRHGDRSQR